MSDRMQRWFVIRWVAVWVLGVAGLSWASIAGHVFWLVNFAMCGCWGCGVGQMARWDRDRLLARKIDP